MNDVIDRPSGMFRYLEWMFTPADKRAVTSFYELYGNRPMSENGRYLNLGYWADAKNIDEACQGMARLLGERAELAEGQRVLDVGFGFADQDLYWMETFRPQQIVGVNITPSQVEVARARVAERGLTDRIDLRVGSATDLTMEPASFDRVVALECAFHFNTRETFFHEAYRVLRPGGRIALTDIILGPQPQSPLKQLSHRLTWASSCRGWVIPEKNVYGQKTYAEKLTAAGFRNVRIESLWEKVYPPLHRFMQKPGYLKRFHPLTRIQLYGLSLLDPKIVYSAFDYVIATADKAG